MMELLKVWYSDENVLARQKMLATMVKHVTPLFIEIIQQGVQEGVFTTPYPENVSQVIINLGQPLGDSFAEMLLSAEAIHDHALQRAETLIVTYNDAVERILGAPKGSIHLMDTEALKQWFSSEDTLQSETFVAEAGTPTSGNP
jgi:hypothetical protein